MKEIVKREGEIVLGIENLDAYLNALKEFQKKIFSQLGEEDYKLPYDNAPQKILTFSGARKLGKILRASVEVSGEDYIYQDNEIFAVKIKLRVSLPNGDYIDAIGICGYDEDSVWVKDKATKKKIAKQPIAKLVAIAYKRAYVKAIKLLLGLPDFADELLEEEEKESIVEEIKQKERNFNVSDKQLEFFSDLFIKRHLSKSLAVKIIERLIDLYQSNQLDTQAMSSAIDYLTKYKKKEDWDKDWGNENHIAVKLNMLYKFLDLIGRKYIIDRLNLDNVNEGQVEKSIDEEFPF